MSNSTGIPGGTENAVDSIEPLESGRPDVMQSPPSEPDVDAPEREGEIPLDPEGVELEEDMSDVDAADTAASEHP